MRSRPRCWPISTPRAKSVPTERESLCTHRSRMTFLEQLVAHTRRLVIGDPLDPPTEVGSLISPEQAASVMEHIESGQRQGANLICGGRRWGDIGNFVEPTIFADCQDEMTIAREEIFGPVLCLFTFQRKRKSSSGPTTRTTDWPQASLPTI